MTLDELISIVLDALKGCVQGDSVGSEERSVMQKLTKENCSVAVVGVDLPFRELSEEEIAPYVNALTQWIVCFTPDRTMKGGQTDRQAGRLVGRQTGRQVAEIAKSGISC